MRDWTARFGFDTSRQPDNLTLALGTGATTPLQLASAYGVLANGGYLLPSTLIKRVTGAAGEVIFEAPPQAPTEEVRVTTARNTYVTSTLLQEVTRAGTAARAQATLKRADLYGKTGTTNEVVDAWFAGFQPGLVAVVWIGHDNPRSLGSHASGSSLALPAWIEFMGSALKNVAEKELSPPDGLLRVDGNWRYAEWALGGFIPSLGLDGNEVGRHLLQPAAAQGDARTPAANAPLKPLTGDL